MQERRLAAIMFTDIVGYTALMGKDEDRAFETLRINKEIHTQLIEKHHGTLIKEMGDETLVSFNSSSDAVRCAIEIQAESKIREIPLKIGIHEGEMVFAGDDVLGDGVNIASRLEAVTESGGITISEAIYRNVKNKPGIYTAFLEEKLLKNVDEPVKIYQVSDQEIHVGIKKPEKTTGWVTKNWIYVLVAAGILLIAAVLIWKFLPGNEKNLPASEVVLEKSIAVIPFQDNSPDQGNEYFCNGIREEILNNLVMIKDLDVKSRTSADQYRNTDKDAITIGKELNAAFILEGSVMKYGEMFRLFVQLIETATDNHLWSESYDGKYSDSIFVIQANLAKKIASSLNAAITPAEQKRIERPPTTDPVAWDLYLRGRQLMFAQDHEAAEVLFDRALELDPNLAQAVWGKGFIALYSGPMLEHYDTTRRFPKARNAMMYAKKAIELNPDCIEAYNLLTDCYSKLWIWDLQTENALRTVEKFPNDYWANLILSDIYFGSEDYINTLIYLSKTMKIEGVVDPKTYNMAGIIFMTLGDYEKAEKYLKIALSLQGRYGWGPVTDYFWLQTVQGKFKKAGHFLDSICSKINYADISSNQQAKLFNDVCNWCNFYNHFYLKDYDQAKMYFNSGLKQWNEPQYGFDSVTYAVFFKKLGREEEANAKLKRWINHYETDWSKYRNTGWWPLEISYPYATLGEKTKALEYLSEAVNHIERWKYGQHDFILIDPIFEDLRNDPEFKALVKRVQEEKAALRAQVREMEERGEIDL